MAHGHHAVLHKTSTRTSCLRKLVGGLARWLLAHRASVSESDRSLHSALSCGSPLQCPWVPRSHCTPPSHDTHAHWSELMLGLAAVCMGVMLTRTYLESGDCSRVPLRV